MIDLLEIPDFLDDDARAALLAELRAATRAPATVLSEQAEGTVRAAVRRSTRVEVSSETRGRVAARLAAARPALEAHFGAALGACEPPQFLRYETGDFFVPHQDGNTPLVWDDSRFRRVSAVVFLSPRSDVDGDEGYGGGALIFHPAPGADDAPVPASGAPGSLVAFRAETTHEVTAVTYGERFTIAAFFRAPEASSAPLCL